MQLLHCARHIFNSMFASVEEIGMRKAKFFDNIDHHLLENKQWLVLFLGKLRLIETSHHPHQYKNTFSHVHSCLYMNGWSPSTRTADCSLSQNWHQSKISSAGIDRHDDCRGPLHSFSTFNFWLTRILIVTIMAFAWFFEDSQTLEIHWDLTIKRFIATHLMPPVKILVSSHPSPRIWCLQKSRNLCRGEELHLQTLPLDFPNW